jgi:hypothetical protein
MRGYAQTRAEKLRNLLHTHSIFRRRDLLNKSAARCLNKRINFQASGSTSLQRQQFFHAQSVLSRLDSYNFGAWLDYNFFCSHKASEARPIVWTTAEFFVWTKEHDSKPAR